MDLVTLRTALLITLSILLVVIVYRRFRHRVMLRDLPVVSHAELIALHVAYHPARLHVLIKVPTKQELRMHVLSVEHEQVHTWPSNAQGPGEVQVELELPEIPDGTYNLEMATATQRTVRQFRLQRT